MPHTYYVYILTNQTHSTLYIGVTNSLESRVTQHKNGEIEGFTQRYYVNRLVYYEEFKYVYDAIAREKQLKKWNRTWKERLINEFDPDSKGDSRLRGNDTTRGSYQE